MKNIIIVMLLCVLSMTAKAQVTPSGENLLSMAGGKRNAAGTIVAADTTIAGGADTTYLYWQIGGACDQMISATLTKISGTLGGAALFQGSLTGVWTGTWFTLKSDQTNISAGQVIDTATLSNATATYTWVHPRHKFKYYRVRFITTAGAAAPSGTIYYRKND